MVLQSLLGLLFLIFLHAHFVDLDSPISPMRAIKCVIPNGLEHVSRAALFQQCISKNYGNGNETRCYPELGCFEMSSPWTGILRPFPSPLHPAEINVTISCFTREAPEGVEIQLWPTIDFKGCPYSPGRRTVAITHGFANDGKSEWISKLRTNYLNLVDVNVLVVDWGRGARLLNYLQVASNTRVVAAELARLIRIMMNANLINPENIHLIGHSLGAQISGYAAKIIKQETATLVDRITALDAAQPGFEGTNARVRLNRTDAAFIDSIHTNGLPIIPTLGFGLITPVGHVDIYMNGGLTQPGCQILSSIPKLKSISDLKKFPVEVINKWVGCSHGRAYHYFTQALNSSCMIWARKTSLPTQVLSAGTFGLSGPLFASIKKCKIDTCLPLGLDTPKFKGRGVFAATTSLFTPFCDNPKTSEKIIKEMQSSSGSWISNILG